MCLKRVSNLLKGLVWSVSAQDVSTPRRGFLLTFFVVALAFSTFTGGCYCESPEFQKHMRFAQRYFDQGQWDKANVEVEKALNVDPENTAAKALREKINEKINAKVEPPTPDVVPESEPERPIEVEPTHEPEQAPEPASESGSEPESDPEPEHEEAASQSGSEPESEVAPEPEPEPEPTPEPEPEPEPTPEPEPEPDPTPEPEPEPDPTPEPDPEPYDDPAPNVRRLVLTINGVKAAFRLAESGSFMMGSTPEERKRFNKTGKNAEEEEKQHEVELDEFWIAETETTQRLWDAVMGSSETPSSQEQMPVTKRSWEDCDQFIRELNNRFGSQAPEGFVFALPTSQQWEYACRAGSATAFAFGDILKSDMANFKSSGSANVLKEVGAYDCNAWALYDMHGNVSEWTRDVWVINNANGAQATHSGSQSYEIRGGDHHSTERDCRSAARNYRASSAHDLYVGFRLALVRKDSVASAE